LIDVHATIVARFACPSTLNGHGSAHRPVKGGQHQEHTMSDNKAPSEQQDQLRINLQDDASMQEWAKKLDATPEQLKEAVAAVGDLASDVEAHLKGSRSSVNSERVHNAL
jgi:hypothetical protein